MPKAKKEPERYFRVVNWERYQDYHHKNATGVPPWIKLSTQFFDDIAVANIPESQRLCLVAVFVMCARCKNRVPFSSAYIAKRCGLRTRPDLDLFVAQGFIEILDVTTPRVASGSLRPRGEKRRGEEKRTLSGAVAPAPAWTKLAADAYEARFGIGTWNERRAVRFNVATEDVRREYGNDRVVMVWTWFIRRQDDKAEFLTPEKFAGCFLEWERQMSGAPARAGPQEKAQRRMARLEALATGRVGGQRSSLDARDGGIGDQLPGSGGGAGSDGSARPSLPPGDPALLDRSPVEARGERGDSE